ncbi:hypothetical protein NDU88_000585 [Pleurodeles waltl]|uniref:Uncharacterized protein n=1 Tax=Pleurodeles waltl TaxID=8319 RepID=A0AAV7N8C6_PLEWA|nr:hypothetical protein NDU88_000585 [Pleurodeles waltl]
MRRLNIEDRLALSLRPRALTHVRHCTPFFSCLVGGVAPETPSMPRTRVRASEVKQEVVQDPAADITDEFLKEMLLEAIKSHGIEWVRQRITGAGSVSPMPQESQVRSPKRARKVPARYRDTDAQPAQHRASIVENIVLVPHKKVESPVLGTGGAPPAPVVLNAAPIQSPAVGVLQIATLDP